MSMPSSASPMRSSTSMAVSWYAACTATWRHMRRLMSDAEAEYGRRSSNVSDGVSVPSARAPASRGDSPSVASMPLGRVTV